MNKTNFLSGVFIGIIISVALAVMVGYLVFERLEKPAPSKPAELTPAQDNAAYLAALNAAKTPSEILSVLDKIIAARPNDAAAHIAKADLLAQLGDYEGAIAAYTRALAIEPANVNAYMGRAAAYFMAGNHAAALKDLNIALQLDPQMAQAWYNRGVVNVNLAQMLQAETDFTKARDLFLKSGDKANSADAARALRLVQDFKAQPLKSKPQLAVKNDIAAAQKSQAALIANLSNLTSAPKGLLEKFSAAAAVNRAGDLPDLGDLGNYEAAARAAMAQAKEKREQAPKNFLDYRAGGQKKLAAGDCQGAISDFDRAISETPDRDFLYMDRARARLQCDDLRGALEDTNKAISVNPKNAGALLQKSRLESAFGNKKTALNAAKTARDIFKEQGNPQGALAAQNQINLHEGRAVEAGAKANPLEKAFTSATKNYEKGDYKAAYDDFSKMIEMQPKQAGNYFNRALAAIQMNDLENAKKDLNEAARLDKNDAKSRILLSDILIGEGQFAAAAAMLDAAKNIAPDNPDNLRVEAKLKLLRDGDIDGAIQIVQNLYNADKSKENAELLEMLQQFKTQAQ